jgi:hypothetical protein
MLFTLAALAPAPPAFGVPALFDAFWGWLAALVALVLPFALLSRRTHRVFGHWTRLFAQWRRRSWWLLVSGALAVSVGIFILAGALPAWQNRWAAWYAAASASAPQDAPAFAWMSQMQSHLAQVLQLAALALILLGLIALIISIRHMLRKVLVRRPVVTPSTEWLMGAPPVTRSHPETSFH